MSESRFVVRRLNWRAAGALVVRLPGEVRLASFDTFDAADAGRAKRKCARVPRRRVPRLAFRCSLPAAEGRRDARRMNEPEA